MARRAEADINYKAHIPAGVLFTAVVAFFAGLPAVIPFLLGGAFGGALPDIDIDGSAVQKMGSKTVGNAGRVAQKVTKGRAKAVSGITKMIGRAIDSIILTPIANGWRWLAKNVFGKAYRKVYSIGAANGKVPLGEKLHWDDGDPSSHRGGITHSFLFLIGSCLITVPISLLVQSFAFWAGCEVGILSHLVADSMCRSGVKFFWPFIVPIGFPNPKKPDVGRGIRILPPQLQVVTGAAQKSNQEIDNMANEQEAAVARKLKHREVMWQWIFKLGALAFIVMLLVGVGPAPGGFSWSFEETGASIFGAAQTQPAQQQSQQPSGAANSNAASAVNDNSGGHPSQAQNGAGAAGQEQQGQSQSQSQQTATGGSSGDIATDGASVAGVNPIGSSQDATGSVPETAGPRSLTNGDVSVKNLPRGVYKTPDERLWIVGVGEVNEQNLENPRWVFTTEEKQALLRAAKAQRSDGIPSSATQFASDAANLATNAARAGSDTANEASNAATSGASGVIQWLREVTGIGAGDDGSAYDGGFLGITPYT